MKLVGCYSLISVSIRGFHVFEDLTHADTHTFCTYCVCLVICGVLCNILNLDIFKYMKCSCTPMADNVSGCFIILLYSSWSAVHTATNTHKLIHLERKHQIALTGVACLMWHLLNIKLMKETNQSFSLLIALPPPVRTGSLFCIIVFLYTHMHRSLWECVCSFRAGVTFSLMICDSRKPHL